MDLSFILDWVIENIKKLSATTILSIISTILTVISTYIAFTVFYFNKKMGYSKLSASPIIYPYDQSLEQSAEQSPELSSLDFTHHLRHLTWIREYRGLPINIIERRLNKVNNGIASDPRFTPGLLTIKLKNKGELASTNIEIVLVFKAYGSKIKYVKNEKDNLNWKSFKRKIFSKKKIVVKVPYMGADDQKEFAIIDLKAQFTETELILCKIKANGHTYFKEKLLAKIFNRVIISHYVHPYLGGAADGSDMNALLGLAHEEEEWVDPYKRERIGVIIWLRNLYAEWRR